MRWEVIIKDRQTPGVVVHGSVLTGGRCSNEGSQGDHILFVVATPESK